MTNKEKYKQAFSAVHAPEKFTVEVKQMEKTTRRTGRRALAVALAACLFIVCFSTVAYAADLGGIQRTVQLWIRGDQTQATIDFESDGSYSMEYTDKDGNVVQSGGGGVAVNPDGSERPLTQAELLEHLNAPDVRYEENGSVWVYYYDQKVEITDKFVDGVCYVRVSHGANALYMTIEYENGWSTSTRRYLEPSAAR